MHVYMIKYVSRLCSIVWSFCVCAVSLRGALEFAFATSSQLTLESVNLALVYFQAFILSPSCTARMSLHCLVQCEKITIDFTAITIEIGNNPIHCMQFGRQQIESGKRSCTLYFGMLWRMFCTCWISPSQIVDAPSCRRHRHHLLPWHYCKVMCPMNVFLSKCNSANKCD